MNGTSFTLTFLRQYFTTDFLHHNLQQVPGNSNANKRHLRKNAGRGQYPSYLLLPYPPG